MKLSDRTFGLELEFGDIDKEQLRLPSGWKFDENERSIVNSNSTRSTPSGRYGAEINTKPLRFCKKDLSELRSFIKHAFECGGKVMWNTGFDGHIYIGDLELEDIKKIFALGYFTSSIIKKVFNLGKWFDVDILVPTPTYEFYRRAMDADSMDALKNVFANSSKKGFVRFPINVMSFFRTKTCEFRIFNGSKDFYKTIETIKFMYRFVDYALSGSICDFEKIKTEEDFKKVFKIKKEFEKATEPLIFAEDVNVFTSNIAKAFDVPRNIVGAISKATPEKIATINPFMFSLELRLCNSKKITIYNQSECNDIIYKICKEGLKIEYKDHLTVLNKHKDGSPERELCLFFIFARIHKYSLNTEYGAKEFLSYVEKIEDSIEKLSETSRQYMDLFEKCEYVVGNLNTAISKETDIVFQQEYYSKHSGIVAALKKMSDYSGTFEKSNMSYYDIQERCKDKNLLVVSRNQFLPMNKIAKDLGVFLYGSKEEYKGYRAKQKKEIDFAFKIPDDDYEITETSDIAIKEIKPLCFRVLQKAFVKKVAKFTLPRFCYVIMDGELIIGAFGFDFPKDEKYSLWLLSDFCTNNNVKKLSKFVLFLIKTQEVKKMLERKIVRRLENCYTKIYTTMPVSMKYRGAFKKSDVDGDRCLVYDFDFGSGGSIVDAKNEFLRRFK